MNINGRNGLACVTRLPEPSEPVVISPLPEFPVVRDPIVDMGRFFVAKGPPPEKEYPQSPEARERLDLYECTLCVCCATFCPFYW